MKILNKYIALLAIVTLLGVQACNDDDATGHSTMVPTNPSISVTGAGTYSSAEDSGDVYAFDITLSEFQKVDVAVHITQSAGDATMGEDYVLSTSTVIIPAYKTSGSFTVAIENDCAAEASETFTLQIGDDRTANASISPVTSDFTITNYSSNDLGIDMSWSTEITDVTGAKISDTDAADLRLLVVDAQPYTAIEGGADGGSFETYELDATTADGDYYVVADFYSAIDLGDQGVFDIGVSVSLGQCGVAGGETYDFGAALSNAFVCSNNHFYLAKITKSGSSWSFEPVGQLNGAASIIGGDYTEVNDDGNPQTAAVTISTADADGYFTVTNAAFSSDWWCAHADATMELAVDGLDIIFPDGATTQVIGGIDEMCGVYGPVSVTLQGPGSIDFCSGEIELEVQVTVAAGSFGNAILTYTPN